MLSRWIRTWDSAVLKPLLLLLASCGITPNILTIGSLALVAASGLLVALGHTVLGGSLLLAGGLADGLDGALARVCGAESARGAFLDSSCDHIGDFAVYGGMVWLLLERGLRTEVLLVLAAQFGSVFGSQVRSRAGMLGIDTKEVGFFTRLERILTLTVGLCTGWITPALWVLAVGVNVSALQRLLTVLLPRR